MEQRFVLRVVDKNGVSIDASDYHPTSPQDAAIIAHAFQSLDSCTVMITDESQTPHMNYRIDESGEPIPI